MGSSAAFIVVLLAATVISVAMVIPQSRRKDISPGTVKALERNQVKYREKRQHSDECDNAQANLYEHDHGDDCMSIFYGHDNPFYDRLLWTEDFANKYCNVWRCEDFVPEFLDDVINACGFDFMTVLSDRIAAACHIASDREFCELKWQYLDDIMNNENTSLAAQYGRCVGRVVTQEKCPQLCATALDGVIDNVGCCYGDLMSIKKKDGDE